MRIIENKMVFAFDGNNKCVAEVEDGETLAEVVKTTLNREERTVAIGACVWYRDFALRIDSMHGDKITRVEVIKSV